MKTVQISNGISVAVKKTRRRSLGLIIRPGGKVELTLPYFVSFKRGVAFLEEKRAWILEKQKKFALFPPSFLRQGNREEFETLRQEARAVIALRSKYFEAWYGVHPAKIVIRNTRSRWGSCSRLGTLSFSYRVVLLPERLRDYIVVHELCHLKAFNHSGEFWSLVAQTFPDYRELRGELKTLR